MASAVSTVNRYAGLALQGVLFYVRIRSNRDPKGEMTMIIHTDGDPKSPVILLLHPMLLSGQMMIDLLGKKIPGTYYLIAPDQAGHGEEEGNPFTPKQDVEELCRFLKEKEISEIELLFAASMGGATAMEFMRTADIPIRNVHLDGIPLADEGFFRQKIDTFVTLQALKKTKKDTAFLNKMLVPIYGEQLAESMAKQMSRLNAENIRQISKTCSRGCAVELEPDRFGQVVFEWGEKEVNIRKGKPLVEKMYPWARILVREGLDHCEYLGKHPEAYAKELNQERNR